MNDVTTASRNTGALFKRVFLPAMIAVVLLGCQAASARAAKDLAAQYPNPFKLMQRAQFCYSIDPDADPWSDSRITPYQKPWHTIFLVAQFLSVMHGYDLFAAGPGNDTGLKLNPIAQEIILDDGPKDYYACAAEARKILPALRDLITGVYLPPWKKRLARHLKAAVKDGAYFGKLRRNEEYWCHAVMVGARRILETTPRILASHQKAPVEQLLAGVDRHITFWKSRLHGRQIGGSAGLDVGDILDGLRHSGTKVQGSGVENVIYAFFLTSLQRCHARRKYIEQHKDSP